MSFRIGSMSKQVGLGSLTCLFFALALCGCGTPKPPAEKAPPPAEPVAKKWPPVVVDAEMIPRDVLFGNPDWVAARLSPDGKRLSYLAPSNGVMNVFVGPADDPKAARPVTQDKKRGIRVYFWAYTNEHVLYLQDKDGDENWHVFAVDLNTQTTKDLTPIAGVRAAIEKVSYKHPDEILVGLNDRDPALHDIHKINIRTGERTLVQENPGFVGFLVDDDYTIRFANKMTPDGGMQMFKPVVKDKAQSKKKRDEERRAKRAAKQAAKKAKKEKKTKAVAAAKEKAPKEPKVAKAKGASTSNRREIRTLEKSIKKLEQKAVNADKRVAYMTRKQKGNLEGAKQEAAMAHKELEDTKAQLEALNSGKPAPAKAAPAPAAAATPAPAPKTTVAAVEPAPEKKAAPAASAIGEEWELFDTVGMEDMLTTAAIDFDKTGNVLYMIDSRGRNTAAFVTLDLKTGEKKMLAEHPKADISDLMIHPTEKTVEAAAFTYERKEWKILDEEVGADLKRLGKLAEGDYEVVSRTLDDRQWIVAYVVDDGPVRYYRINRDERREYFLFTNRTDLEGATLVTMIPSVIKTRDGKELVNYLSLPPGSDPEWDGRPKEPLPMVLNVHGGPWARVSWGYDPSHQWFANRGYAVLSVNFRGVHGLW